MWKSWFCTFSQTEAKSEEGPGWKILRDDFMMGASMKDWDKESDEPAGGRAGAASDWADWEPPTLLQRHGLWLLEAKRPLWSTRIPENPAPVPPEVQTVLQLCWYYLRNWGFSKIFVQSHLLLFWTVMCVSPRPSMWAHTDHAPGFPKCSPPCN